MNRLNCNWLCKIVKDKIFLKQRQYNKLLNISGREYKLGLGVSHYSNFLL